jgi:hypothetical protein
MSGRRGLKVTLNRKQLEKDIFVKGEKILIKQLQPILDERVNDIQKDMVNEFESHPVSKEISAGNETTNTSGLLGGYGNLFSFIGFDEGQNPILPISRILNKRIYSKIQRRNNNGSFNLTIFIPDKEDVYANAQVGWMGGRSWADGIEKGIAGLNRFLYDEDGFKNSRSVTGIQTKNKVLSSSAGRTPYISEIINNFKKRLARLI